MKLIIDIPDEDYKFIKDLQSLIIGGRGNCKTIQKNVINAIRNGTPYNPSGNLIDCELLKSLEYINKGNFNTVEGIREWIDNAPTVEPEKVYLAKVQFDEDKLKEIVQTQVIDKINSGELVLKDERPQDQWIPVSERLPENKTEVLIQYGQSIMVGYHKVDCNVYPTDFEDIDETGWYDIEDNFICGSDEVIAWRSLPEPYENCGADMRSVDEGLQERAISDLYTSIDDTYKKLRGEE